MNQIVKGLISLSALLFTMPAFAEDASLNSGNSAWILTSTALVLFMTLPGPMHALDAWDALLAAARRAGEILGADLMDSERNPFSRQREAQIREEMREYDREKNPVD